MLCKRTIQLNSHGAEVVVFLHSKKLRGHFVSTILDSYFNEIGVSKWGTGVKGVGREDVMKGM
jgi:hypothetical protein